MIDGKDIANNTKLVKKLMQYLSRLNTNKYFCQNYMKITKRETKDGIFNDKKPWKRKYIRKLLLTMIVADLKRFTIKDKLIIYIGAFIKLFN